MFSSFLVLTLFGYTVGLHSAALWQFGGHIKCSMMLSLIKRS